MLGASRSSTLAEYLRPVASAAAAVVDSSAAHEHFWDELVSAIDSVPLTIAATAEKTALESERGRRLVVHMGDHLQFAGNSTSCGGLVAAYLLARLTGRRHAIVEATSRNSLHGGSGIGPGYFRHGGRSWRVLDLNAKQMKQSVLGLLDPVRFSFEHMHGGRAGAEPSPSVWLRKLLPELFDHMFPNAAAAFRASYHAIWRAFGFDERVKLIVLDSSFTAGLATRCLGDPGTVAYRLAADRDLDRQVREHRVILADRTPFLSDQTAWYWWVRNGRLVPLARSGDRLVHGDTVVTSSDPYALGEALLDGRITPDLTMQYLLEAVTTGAVVTGGVSQYEYFPRMHALSETASRRRMVSENFLLHGIVEPPVDLPQALKCGLVERAEQMLDSRLVDVGSLSAFDYLIGMQGTTR